MIGREKRKWTPSDKIPDMRRKCLGKGNFLIRLLLEINETVDALTELVNQVHGNNPERRKSENSSFLILRTTAKAM